MNTFFGMKEQRIHIPAQVVQKAVSEFTQSPRFFTGYPSDKIEHILRYYNFLTEGWLYAGFDTVLEECIFTLPISWQMDHPLTFSVQKVILANHPKLRLSSGSTE